MYKLTLIIRYLLKRRITHFAILAVALCVFIVVVVMTIMTGLVEDFKQKNHRFVGDCVVGTDSLVGFPYYEEFMEVLKGTDFAQAVSPAIKSYGLLSVQGDRVRRGIEIIGIDPALHAKATNFAQTLRYRAKEPDKAFRPEYNPDVLGCVLGIDLVLARDATGGYNFDDQPLEIPITLTCFPLTARGAPAKVGAGLVETQHFFYSDHSHTGIAHVDGATV